MKKIVVKATAVFFALLFSLSFLAGCQDNEPTFMKTEKSFIQYFDVNYGVKNIEKSSKTHTVITLKNNIIIRIDYNEKSNKIKKVQIEMFFEELIASEQQQDFIIIVVDSCFSLDTEFVQDTATIVETSLKKSFVDKEYEAKYNTKSSSGLSYILNYHDNRHSINFLIYPKDNELK